MSGHFNKAKKIYRLKKIFNQRRLKPYFDIFLVKVFYNYKRGMRILSQGGQIESLRTVLVHKLLGRRMIRGYKRGFHKLYANKQRHNVITRKLKYIS